MSILLPKTKKGHYERTPETIKRWKESFGKHIHERAPEMRERIRNKLIGRKHTDKEIENMIKAWTPEKREALRIKRNGTSWSPDTQFKKGQNAGDKHLMWKGGITKMKEIAKKRDNFTCQKCGLKDREILEVDHDIPIAINKSLQYVLSNLVTLCPNCHKRKTIKALKDKLYYKGYKNKII